MKLGDYVKYEKDGNEILAVIQAKLKDGTYLISLPGGEVVKVDSLTPNEDFDQE